MLTEHLIGNHTWANLANKQATQYQMITWMLTEHLVDIRTLTNLANKEATDFDPRFSQSQNIIHQFEQLS